MRDVASAKPQSGSSSKAALPVPGNVIPDPIGVRPGNPEQSAKSAKPQEREGTERDDGRGTPTKQWQAVPNYANSVSPCHAAAAPILTSDEFELGHRMKPGCRTVHMVATTSSTETWSPPTEAALTSRQAGGDGLRRRDGLRRNSSSCGNRRHSDRRLSVRRKSIKRLSQQFLSFCLCDDDDFWSVPSHDSEAFNTPPSSPTAVTGCASFCMDGGDSENEDGSHYDTQDLSLEEIFSFDLERIDKQDCLEVEDLFSFDLDIIAAALRRGDGLEQLQEVITSSMTASIESTAVHPTLPGPEDPSPLMAGDLSGRMTPGQMTPKSTDSAETGSLATGPLPQLESLAKRLAEAPTPERSRRSRRRRSSIVQSRLSVAVDEACAQNRQSLANAAAQEYRAQLETTGSSKNKEDVTVAVRECVMKSHKQHRQSLLQAAEVVELASLRVDSGLDEEWGAEHLTASQLTMQLQLVQQAIQGAQQMHRERTGQNMIQSAGQDH